MYYLSSSAPQELISSHAHNLTTGDPFEEPYPAKSDDDSWLPIPNGHDAPFPTESSAENAPSSAIRSDSLGINASVSDATSNFMDAASSMGIHQQENENSPTSVAGIKHGLESPDEETGRAKSRRRKGEPEPDYSAMSRQKIMQVKRTGQACDRCKVCQGTYTVLPATWQRFLEREALTPYDSVSVTETALRPRTKRLSPLHVQQAPVSSHRPGDWGDVPPGRG